MRVAIRVLLLPVIAGVSYEVLKLAGRSENPVVNLLSRPGLAIQKLTTREPDESMIEVAIAAVEAVFDWRAYERRKISTLQTDIPGREKNSLSYPAFRTLTWTPGICWNLSQGYPKPGITGIRKPGWRKRKSSGTGM